ncbi:MAG: serine/threonine-protein kinase [Prosthecobacter sp.]
MPKTSQSHPLPPDMSDAVAAAVLGDVLVPRDIATHQPGDEVGPYILVEQLGTGGFGTVWLAEQEEPVRRTVALKILKLGMDTLEVMARFEQERKTLALMDHPNIAKVVDAGATSEGRPYFAMELVRGEPLTKYCLTKKLPLEQKLRLFQSVCAGVQHAHQKGIIHRDLKPSNILVTEIDGVAVPKIIDFGIAKATTTDRLSEFTLVTRAEHLLGTPIYMSPEQADAHPDIDTRSDVYSLGALLYELLTGQPPFDVKTLHAAGYEEMRRIIREVEPRPPSGRNDEGQARTEVRHSTFSIRHSRDLDLITLQALAKDRERRYQSATALREDIEHFLNHEPIQARAPSALYLTQSWVRRHWLATAAIIGGLALIAIGTATTFWQKQKAEAALQILAGTMSDTQYGSIYYLQQEKMIDSLDRATAIADSLSEANQMHLFTGLSRAYHDLRQWDQALACLEKAEALTVKLKLPANILRRHQEAHILVLLALKRGKEALALADKILPDYEKNLMPDDPGIIFLHTVRAKALRVAGRPKEAVAAFESLFERLKNWPAEVHPIDTVNAHLSYPIALRQAGEPERALEEARKNIRLSKRLLGLIDQHTARAYVQAGNECETAGLLPEAIEHQHEAWELFIDLLGPSHFSTTEARNDLLRLHKQAGLTEETLKMLHYTVTSFKAQNGTTDPGTLEATETLIEALIKAGKNDEAKISAQATLAELEAQKELPTEIRRTWVPKFKAALAE